MRVSTLLPGILCVGSSALLFPQGVLAQGYAVHRAEAKAESGEVEVAGLIWPYYRADLSADAYNKNGFDFDAVHLAVAYRFDRVWNAGLMIASDRFWTSAADAQNRFNVLGNYLKLAYIKANDLLGRESVSTFGLQLNPYFSFVEAPMGTTWIGYSLPFQTLTFGYFNAGVSTQAKLVDDLTYSIFISDSDGWLRRGDATNALAYSGLLNYKPIAPLAVTLSDVFLARPRNGGGENILTLSANWSSPDFNAMVESLWLDHRSATPVNTFIHTALDLQGPLSAVGYGLTTRFSLVRDKVDLFLRFFSGNAAFQENFLMPLHGFGEFGKYLATVGPIYHVRKQVSTGLFFETEPLTDGSAAKFGYARYNEISWKWTAVF